MEPVTFPVALLIPPLFAAAAAALMFYLGRRWRTRFHEHFAGRPGFRVERGNGWWGPVLVHEALGFTSRATSRFTRAGRWCVTVRPNPLRGRARFTLVENHALSRLAAVLGWTGVTLGRPDFDQRFQVRGEPADTLRGVLASRELQDALLALPRGLPGHETARVDAQGLDVEVTGRGLLQPEALEELSRKVHGVAALLAAQAEARAQQDGSRVPDAVGGRMSPVAALRVDARPGSLLAHFHLQQTWPALVALCLGLAGACFINSLSIFTCERTGNPRNPGWCSLRRGSVAFEYTEEFSVAVLKGASVESGTSAVGSYGKEGGGFRVYIHTTTGSHRFIDNDEWSPEQRESEARRITAYVNDATQPRLEVTFDRRPVLLAEALGVALLVGLLSALRHWQQQRAHRERA